MSKAKKKSKKKKKKIPFWAQILVIICIGAIISAVVFFFVSNIKKEEVKQESERHTVTFAEQDGTVIETKKVSDGRGVFPPECNSDMVFRGWSGAVNEVTADTEVHPQFMEITDDNLFYFNSVYVQEGKEFTVDVKLGGMVNISSATLLVSYDSEVMEFIKSKDESICKVSKNKDGELTLSLQSNSKIAESTQISQLTFMALEKDVYATQIDLSCKDGKIKERGVEKPATVATINNKIYYLQEVE